MGHVGVRGGGQCGDAYGDRECGLDGVEVRGFVMCGGMRWGSGWCGRQGVRGYAEGSARGVGLSEAGEWHRAFLSAGKKVSFIRRDRSLGEIGH